MRRTGGWAMLAAAGAGLVVAAQGASAQPAASTKYVYYTVKGGSAVELYQTLIARGPKVKGVKAYATTTAVSSQSGRLVQGSNCRLSGYKVSMNFTIKLPKLAGPIPPAAGREWGRFSAFLKQHEETHRSIWLGCGRDMERKVASLTTKNCGDLNRKTMQLWKQVNAACNRQHERFDAEAQHQLLRQPFVKLVMREASTSQRALAVPKRKRK